MVSCMSAGAGVCKPPPPPPPQASSLMVCTSMTSAILCDFFAFNRVMRSRWAFLSLALRTVQFRCTAALLAEDIWSGSVWIFAVAVAAAAAAC